MHKHYSATAQFSPGTNHATLSDIFTLETAAFDVFISKVHIAAQQTGAGNAIFRMIRRQVPNTGGTRALVDASPWDTLSPPATCSIYAYTAHPTAVGTQLGAYRTTPFQFDNGGLHTGIITWEFGQESADPEVSHPFVVHPYQIFALNVAGLDNAASAEVTIEFYEK